jgi:enoyl-CoA hydratase
MTDLRFDVTVTKQDHVAWLRFISDHPENVFNHAMVSRLTTVLGEVTHDDDIRVLVISGRDDIFTGGVDVADVLALDADRFAELVQAEYAMFRAVEALPFPSVASISGLCIGTGGEIALGCDFRIADQTARIGWPEVAGGVSAPARRLVATVGPVAARQILYFGSRLDASAALRYGIVGEVVAPEELIPRTTEVAARLARRAPLALRRTKENIGRCGSGADVDLAEIAAACETFAAAVGPESARALGARPPAAFPER